MIGQYKILVSEVWHHVLRRLVDLFLHYCRPLHRVKVDACDGGHYFDDDCCRCRYEDCRYQRIRQYYSTNRGTVMVSMVAVMMMTTTILPLLQYSAPSVIGWTVSVAMMMMMMMMITAAGTPIAANSRRAIDSTAIPGVPASYTMAMPTFPTGAVYLHRSIDTHSCTNAVPRKGMTTVVVMT